MESAYISWLRSSGIKLFEGGGHLWRMRFGRVLVPARLGPTYIQLIATEAHKLLQASGAMLLRFSSDPCAEPTDWWYTICDRYDLKSLPRERRRQINRGKRDCRVTPTDPEWLSRHGYPCYLAAYDRYTGTRPVDEGRWRNQMLRGIEGGAREYWAIFVEQELAGYCLCLIDDAFVATELIRFDPRYLKYRTASALINVLCEHYVSDLGRTLTNGNPSVLHDTNMQDFLLENGYRQQFCRLNLVYNRWLGLAIGGAFSMRWLAAKLPKTRHMVQVNALLKMEEIRRACQRR